MKVAIPQWQGRVSPVFDVAGQVLVVEVSDGVQSERQEVALDAEEPLTRAARLAQTGARVLICGAISWPLELALTAAEVTVITQTCGDVEDVLMAYLARELDQEVYRMPGCCGRRRRCRGHRRGRHS